MTRLAHLLPYLGAVALAAVLLGCPYMHEGYPSTESSCQTRDDCFAREKCGDSGLCEPSNECLSADDCLPGEKCGDAGACEIDYGAHDGGTDAS